MNLNVYQEEIKQFAVYPDANTHRKAEFDYLTLGLCSEAGEVAGKVKKLYRDGGFSYWNLPEDRKDALRAELGDVLWYAAMLCSCLETTMEEVAEGNFHKLSARKASNTIKGDGDNR